MGGDVRVGCYAVLKPGGRLVWIAPAPEGFQPPRTDVQTLRPNVARDRAFFARLTVADRQLSEWSGAYHELLHELDRDRLLHQLVAWLRPRLGAEDPTPA